jgi:phosphoribosylamine--glycine ligase
MVVSGGYQKSLKRKSYFWIRKHYGFYCFHAGTKLEEREVVTNGGRVCNILWNDFKSIKKSYQNIDKLHFDKMNEKI